MSKRASSFLSSLTLAVLTGVAFGQAHPEIVVGCDRTGRLAVRFEPSSPFRLPASRFPGIDGYADGLPGFLSLFEARPEQDLFPLDPAAELEFVLLEADAGLGVWNDRGTAVMRVGESFNLGRPPFDSHPVWMLSSGEAGERYGIRLRVRDRSGRHAQSDVVEPEFTPDDATELYICPMKCGGGVFFDAPGHCSLCKMRLKLISARSYRVSVTPEGPAATDGRIRAVAETLLRFRIESPEGDLVEDLEVVHEKLVHLLIVSDDLSWFAHEHPQRQPDGTFTLAMSFPHGGGYTLYHDFTPPRAGMQVVPVQLEIEGDAPAPQPLSSSAVREQVVDGYEVTLETPSPFQSIRNVSLTFRLSREGVPLTDLEPFLGALGHLIVISQDRKHFVHSHPLDLSPRAEGVRLRGGPQVVFSAQFPAPGSYKAWGQFQHRGHVITAPFVLELESPLAAASTGSSPSGSGGDRR